MISPIQQLYYAWDISHKKSVSDDSRFTGVLSEARVDLNPHQVEAALFAFKSPLSKGAILADEVGLGKTIEAGIILSEMWAENKRNILIVVPASLRNQWNIELMEKFYLPSFILDSESFEEGQVQISNGEKSIYICSYNFAVTNAEYFKNISWDLIVLDEAHKLRNVYKKSNVMANALRAAFRNYKKVLLTATPLQNNLKELYGLISVIDPEFFSSLDTFADQYNYVTTRDKAKFGELKGRLAHIIHRTLRNQVEEYVNFTKRTAFVQEYYPTDAEINLYEQVSEYLMREGTYGVPERQRPLLSLLVRKIMSSSAYALGFTLERFIHRLQEYKQTGLLSSALACVNSDIDGANDEYDIYNSRARSFRKESKEIETTVRNMERYKELQPLHDKYSRIFFKKAKEKYYREHKAELDEWARLNRFARKKYPDPSQYNRQELETRQTELNHRISELEELIIPFQEELGMLKDIQWLVRDLLPELDPENTGVTADDITRKEEPKVAPKPKQEEKREEAKGSSGPEREERKELPERKQSARKQQAAGKASVLDRLDRKKEAVQEREVQCRQASDQRAGKKKSHNIGIG